MEDTVIKKTPRVVAIIQARMGSTRLPGKMMAEICGQPLLYHIIFRAQHLQSAHQIILATTAAKRDEPLVHLAQSMGLAVVRGPEENVLQRFIMAVDIGQADIVIRICGDAPLFDPAFLDQAVCLLKEHDADLVCIRDDAVSALQGASVISARALRWTWDTARDDPAACEHVTLYAHTHRDELRSIETDIAPEYLGDFHLSIDTQDDLGQMRQIYAELYKPGSIVSLKRAVQWFKRSAGKAKSHLAAT